jgi:hypothetical protein
MESLFIVLVMSECIEVFTIIFLCIILAYRQASYLHTLLYIYVNKIIYRSRQNIIILGGKIFYVARIYM